MTKSFVIENTTSETGSIEILREVKGTDGVWRKDITHTLGKDTEPLNLLVYDACRYTVYAVGNVETFTEEKYVK